jgi:hypothetical protein
MNCNPDEPLAILSCPTNESATTTYKFLPNLSRSDRDYIGSLRTNDYVSLVHDSSHNVLIINGRVLASQHDASSDGDESDGWIEAPFAPSPPSVGASPSPLVPVASGDCPELVAAPSQAAPSQAATFCVRLVSSSGAEFKETVAVDTPEARKIVEECFKQLYDLKLDQISRSLV